jgi:hypothetical protein
MPTTNAKNTFFEGITWEEIREWKSRAGAQGAVPPRPRLLASAGTPGPSRSEFGRRGVRWNSCLVDARAPMYRGLLFGAHLPARPSLSILVAVRELRPRQLILTARESLR